jgi:hypothetical protein
MITLFTLTKRKNYTSVNIVAGYEASIPGRDKSFSLPLYPEGL